MNFQSETIDSRRSLKSVWLGLYIAINVIAAMIIVSKGELIGDVTSPITDFKTVYIACALVGFFYWLFLGPVFNLAARLKVRPLGFLQHQEEIGSKIGLVILTWQLCFVAFNLIFGTSVAGAGNVSSGSFWGYLFVFFDSDFLFFVYYGIFRQNKYFKYNLAIYIVSNLMRGWSGIFTYILFFESCRLYRARKLKAHIVAALLVLTVVMYPVLTAMKWAIRANAFVGDSAITVISDTVESFDFDDYYTLMDVGVEHIVERLQSVSALVDIIKDPDDLRNDFSAGRFSPFWLEGLQGLIYDRLADGNLLGHTERMPVSVVYWDKLRSDGNPDGVGNVAISFPGWLVIAPLYSAPYLLYSALLGIFPLIMVRKITGDPAAQEMVWLAWLVFLMVPWFFAMVKFLYSVFFFYLLYVSIGKRIRSRAARHMKNPPHQLLANPTFNT